MLDHLLVGLGMTALGETGELLRRNSPGQAHRGRELALPFALNDSILLVVVRCLRRKFELVIRLRLAGTEGFRDVQHGGLPL